MVEQIGGLSKMMNGFLVRCCWPILISIIPIGGMMLPRIAPGSAIVTAASPVLALKQVLKRGVSGRAVITLQQQLRAVGVYDGPVTGFFGERTEAAVRQFQRSRGLTADGVAGSRTLELLRSLAGGQTNFEPFQKGAQGERVREMQLRLLLLGYLDGQVTRNFDNTTQTALVRFQRAQGLSGTGVVDQQTWDRLQSAISVRQVQAMQRRLWAAGFYRGNIDGQLSTSTQRAVAAAQHLYGVGGDDILRGSY